LTKYYKEGFLAQLIFYAIIWLFSEYIGLLICLIMAITIGGLLIFAWIAELIEPSKVPKEYFLWMIFSTLAPIIVTVLYSWLYKGNFDWIN